MRCLTAAASLLLSVLTFIIPVANGQPSPVASCFSCPDTDVGLNILLSFTVPDIITGAFTCVYLESGVCSYDSVTGVLVSLVIDNPLCAGAAINVCRARREERRAKALPRSPKPPSPAAYVPKPRVMQTRKTLREEKARSRRGSSA
ncbi:hypothetical protein EST38_g4433 [Candolleomyces aberdarensis]|uniref:Hydrophobin n=1 Tax=Candolleomyces aberdarensis TaxID=2316362 RepID=A0A4Q2DQG2_9AGAR|nr:hypothetical protein EST38_g4433 [Candolleomyces aberdarensis]